VQLVNSVNPNGQQFGTVLADTMSGLVVSRGLDRVTVDTNVAPVSAAAPTTAVETSSHQAAVQGTAEDRTSSLFGTEANDALAVISNGAVSSESTSVSLRVTPANLIVSGALAFQTNAAMLAATQIAGQVFQIGNLPLVSALATGNASQQLTDRVFLALARWTDTAGDLNLDWLAIPLQLPANDLQPGTQDGQTPDKQDVSERIAVVDQVFAEEMDEFSDLGDF
jgi:hypothetical protein